MECWLLLFAMLLAFSQHNKHRQQKENFTENLTHTKKIQKYMTIPVTFTGQEIAFVNIIYHYDDFQEGGPQHR